MWNPVWYTWILKVIFFIHSRLLCITTSILKVIFSYGVLSVQQSKSAIEPLVLLFQTVFVVLLKFLEMQWNIVSDPVQSSFLYVCPSLCSSSSVQIKA